MNARGKWYYASYGAALILAAGAAGQTFAANFGDIVIHGYGADTYFQPRNNRYFGTDSHGTWQQGTLLSLLITTKLNQKTSVWSQIDFKPAEVKLDWMFVDYQFQDNLVGRVGQIKLPFGLYNDVIDAKFLHQSTLEPQLYSDGSGISQEDYRGLGAIYTADLGGESSLEFNPYFGEPAAASTDTNIVFRRLYGARVTYKTPVDGLKFMVSGYNHSIEDRTVPTSKKVGLLSAGYLSNDWELKAEYAHSSKFNVKGKSYYLQTGYNIGKWTPFVRYDYINTDTHQSSDPSFYQKSSVLGVNYNIGDGVKLRLEDHINRGYAMTVNSGDEAVGAGATNWQVWGASVVFIF